MITGENHQRRIALTGRVQAVQYPSQLIVNLGDHCVVQSLEATCVEGVRVGRQGLEIDVRQRGLGRQIGVAEMRARHAVAIESIGVSPRWDEWRMRVVDVDAEHPGAVRSRSRLADELDRSLTRPGRLMQFRRNPVGLATQVVQVTALAADPLRVIVTGRPIVSRSMTELPVTIPVLLEPRLRPMARTLQVELPDQAAIVSRVR